MTIVLNEADQRLAKYLARERHRHNRSKGVADRKVGPQGAWETDLEGVGAELALCKLFGVYPDTDTTSRPDYDAVISTPFGRVTVDAKCTRYPRGKLLAVPRKIAKPPMAYVLMVGECPTYRCAGFAPAFALLRPERLGTLGHGPTYMMTQAELLTLEQLTLILFQT